MTATQRPTGRLAGAPAGGPARRSGTWQKATALVPLALLSGAWTASLAGHSATAASDEPGRLPDGTTVPVEAIQAPASVSNPGEIAPGIPAGSAGEAAANAARSGIPSPALAAYQRAAQVLGVADPSCHVDWPLLGAIGRVESDHGRYGGNVLNSEGVSRPGIYGIPLDGSNGTQRISDTDAGRFDGDKTYDRAVGPMQFIPSTWQVVGVDGDADGVRNPQDIDDAALATGVYLCSGREDLSTRKGQEVSVYRYNHSQEYVDLVLSIADAYRAGDYSATPSNGYSPMTFGSSSYADSVFGPGTRGHRGVGSSGGAHHHAGGSGAAGSSTGGGTSTGSGTSTTPPSGGTGGGGTTQDPAGPAEDLVDKGSKTVKDTLTPLEKATQYCQSNLTAAELQAIGGLSACTDAYLEGGAAAVQSLLDDILGDLGGVIGGGGGGLPIP